mgnify:CR=1 FL=1
MVLDGQSYAAYAQLDAALLIDIEHGNINNV